ncbi:unnamed protein product [Effrenium voratum]|uniref:Cytochrome b561 domain-containing protein n=1 Tax=Effrenium voratum TaxID=2562239 RepID=A0AA36N7W5_9DINO|nr:unnamed protein product [Effrenium voratum]
MVGPVKGGGGSLSSTFTWHPILMSIGFPCLMMMGRWAYVTDSLGDKEQQRSVHGTIMALATLAAVAGYVCIFLAHVTKRSFFGYNFAEHTWAQPTRVAHDLMGYGILILTLAQASMGLFKATKSAASFKFHGSMGKVIMVLAAGNIVLACFIQGWSTAYRVLVAGLVVAVTACAAFWPAQEQVSKMDVAIGLKDGLLDVASPLRVKTRTGCGP